MSSKNRGSKVEDHEHYRTPDWCIEEFWKSFAYIEEVDIRKMDSILDPCAGGSTDFPCPYPQALSDFISDDPQLKFRPFVTVDIRDNSAATYKENYLAKPFGKHPLIISNPPFSMFEEFVEKGFTELTKDGYLIFLLRINALAGQKRNKERQFWGRYPAKYLFVHSKRPCFIKGGSDSCEYGHFVWQKGFHGKTKIIII